MDARGAAIGLWVLAWAGLLHAGCGSSERTVKGRSRSVVGDPTASTAEVESSATVKLRFARTTDAAGVSDTRVYLRFQADGALGARLRTPVEGAAEEPLVDLGAGLFELDVSGPSASIESRFPGVYAVLVTKATGVDPAVSIDARSGWPATPKVLDPAEGAAGITLGPLVRWEGEGNRFDLAIFDATTGLVAHAAADLIADPHQVPPATLAPGRRYRLEVAAATDAEDAPVRFTAATRTSFDTGVGP